MAYQNATFALEMKDVILIKPSNPTPSIILSLSSIDNAPENNSLYQIVHVYQSANHDSANAKPDPAYVIKEALSKALFYYYPLAGKLLRHADGKLRVNCNSDGVPFIEAICNCELSSLHYLDGNDLETAKHLAFDFPTQDEFGVQYPLVFKVTKFQCGGFTIAMGMSHAVCDGSGASQFLRAMAELASGKNEPSVKPVWERERLVGTITRQPMQSPMDKASAAVSPFLPSLVLSHECFKVDSESIKRLKMSLMKESDFETKKKGFTTFESLGAYVWRSRARALKLSYDGKILLIVIVGVRRHLLDPSLPDGYYGNTIVEAHAMLTVRELNERPLSEVVKLIKERKLMAFTSDYIRNSINTMETNLEGFNIEEGTGAAMTLTDWKHLGFLENVDFGWKEPVNTVPAPCNMFRSVGLAILMPPSNLDPSMKGGARVYISLPSAAMPKFREEMEALKLIEDA